MVATTLATRAVCVDAKDYLIVAHEFTIGGSDRGQLANMASRSRRHGQD